MRALHIRKLSLTITPLDGLMFVLSLGIFVFVTLSAYSSSGVGGRVHIQADSGDYLYSLEEPGEFVFTGPIGETVVQIQDHRVRVHTSDCRDQICVAAGWLEHENEWAACLPNKIFVRVEANEVENVTDGAKEVDLLSY